MTAAKLALLVLAALAAYLLLWPTGMDPVAWTPPAAPKLEGPYAYNEKLRGVQRLAYGIGVGPESVNVNAVGQVYTGYADGRIVMFSPDGAHYTEMGSTGGRPLGITFGPTGGIVVADAAKGLLHLGRQIAPLVTEVDGVPLRFANDVDNMRFGKSVYFTESSTKFGPRHAARDLLEHGANGRLLRYDVATKETRVLLPGLHFPNGVAVGPDDAYVLVCETGRYRVLRYWLKGARAGTHEVFVDNLPGFPDNISYNNGSRFWLALAAPRSERFDALLPGSRLQRLILGRLPAGVLGRAGRHAFVVGLSTDGAVFTTLQYAGDDAFAPITSVRERGPWLYFGSDTAPSLGRLPLNQAVAGALAPPPGWERLAEPQEKARPKTRREKAEEKGVVPPRQSP